MTYWTTTGFTALPSGWINVYESVDLNGELTFTSACPGVVEQICKERDDPNHGDKRFVAASISEGDIDSAEDIDNYLWTTTVEDWDRNRDECEARIRADREKLFTKILAALTEAGNAGMPSSDLDKISFYSGTSTRWCVNKLITDRQIERFQVPNPDAKYNFDGTIPMLRIVTTSLSHLHR